MNQVRKRLLFLCLVCTTIGTLNTGCSDEAAPESDNTILRPLAENVIGRWNEEMCRKNLDGKWEEDPMPEGQGQIYTIRKDGKVVSAHTGPDGYTKLNLGEWKVDEATNKLTLGTMTVDVLKLDATTIVWGLDEAIDTETGELMKGEFQWTFARMDESQKHWLNSWWANGTSPRATRRKTANGWKSPTECPTRAGTSTARMPLSRPIRAAAGTK